MDHNDIERLGREIMAKHGGHALILYGSWARGSAHEASDVDFLCIRASGPDLHDASIIEGVYIDAFVYAEATLMEPAPALLRVVGGRVLHDRDGVASALLEKLQQLHERGPAPLADDERTAAALWAEKMLVRIRDQRGVEVDFRRMQLLTQSLEDYFVLRGMWFRGPKQSFEWLVEHDVHVYRLFERAARPAATDSELAELARAVYG